MLGELVVHLEAETQAFVRPVQQVKDGLDLVSNTANDAIFNLNALARGLAGIQTASNGLVVVSKRFGILNTVAGTALQGVNIITNGLSLLGSMSFNAATGIGLLLKPLAGIGIVAKASAVAFGLLIKAIVAPFRLAFAVVSRLASALWMLAKPLISVAKLFFSLKIMMMSFKVQFQIMQQLLSMLPPQLRVVAVGLVALGAAGRAGSAALNLLAGAAKLAGTAFLLATNPIKGLAVVALAAARSFGIMTLRAYSAAKAMASMAAAGALAAMKSILAAGGNVVTMLGRMAMNAMKTGAAIAAIGIGWGIKLAADAEQAAIGFTTMLKSGNAARKLLMKLEEFAASTPFQLTSLRDGAKQLLNAGVTIAAVTTRLRMLGDIAAGTGQPIGDFVRIFAKVKSTGKVSLETLNQLAERGVPIYSALAQTLGVSREEMLDMISKGKVGFNDLDAALKSTATGAGVFAGGMAAQSQTISGLLSTLKDNVSFAMREVGQAMGRAFNFKGMLSNSISFFQAFRSGVDTIRPLLFSLADTARTVFGAIGEVAGVVFGGIQSASGLTFDSIISGIMQAQAHVRFIAKAWPDFFELVWANAKLNAVTAFNVIAHQITEVIPTALSWFADNWRDIFTTIGSFTGSVFTNLATNAMNILKELWDFIASGGTNAMQVAWKPLTEGFKNTVAELPDIPERAITDLEKSLSQDVARISDVVGNAWNAEFDKIGDYGRKTMQDVANDPATQPDQLADPESQNGSSSASASSTDTSQVAALTKGSKEAFDAINRFRMQGDGDKKTEEKKTAANTERTAKAAEKSAIALEKIAGSVTSPQFAFQVGGLS